MRGGLFGRWVLRPWGSPRAPRATRAGTRARTDGKITREAAEASAAAMTVLARYPDRIPVICMDAPGSNMLDKSRQKLLIPCSMTTTGFQDVVLDRIAQWATASSLPGREL